METKVNTLDKTAFLNKEHFKKLKKIATAVKISTSILPEILVITSYPPRECGIATYSQDLIFALNNKFTKSFNINICALETSTEKQNYKVDIDCILETDQQKSYLELADRINDNQNLSLVLLQHEFGLFKTNEDDFIGFLKSLRKPIVIAFHTVLPNPSADLQKMVQAINKCADAIIVMTNASAKLLSNDYLINSSKISVIQHGTHLVAHTSKVILKEKYNFTGRKIVSTFGLLSSGKCIETSINALQQIVKKNPEVLFLIIGKTHPNVIKTEGEIYRESLEKRITDLRLHQNVKFINTYLPLNALLEYLQLTDIYLFTSKDRTQAVSGTFSYAISCGCPIISTPIPHAIEVLQQGNGIIIDFENPEQLAKQVNHLLANPKVRSAISSRGIHRLASTAWENSAIAHALLFQQLSNQKMEIHYKIPAINLNHFKKLTTDFGMIQFSIINQPDLTSGYTLDDNARALVAICKHFELSKDPADLELIKKYFNFIKYCLQAEGYFLNYVDTDKQFTTQNSENLADSNGRAIWALGYLISIGYLLPETLVLHAQNIMELSLKNVTKIHSPRAIAFIIKGIYYSTSNNHSAHNISVLKHLADRLAQMYQHEKEDKWLWFESYLTYGNSVLPEALLCAFLVTKNKTYEDIALASFEFLLNKIFRKNAIKVISNKGWLHNKNSLLLDDKIGGEQPIDVAYTIIALDKFYETYKNPDYLSKIKIGFDWFLGNNHLQQIIYNPGTGGCYDGLEDTYINLNQGAESTVSYLMARLTIEKYLEKSDEKIFKTLQYSKSINHDQSVEIL